MVSGAYPDTGRPNHAAPPTSAHPLYQANGFPAVRSDSYGKYESLKTVTDLDQRVMKGNASNWDIETAGGRDQVKPRAALSEVEH